MTERTYTRQEILDMLTIYPCHITGMHNPSHTTEYICRDQLGAAVERLLENLDAGLDDLPHELEPDCGWCYRIPSQEQYRERTRDLHRWAEVPISPELAAPAPDAEVYDLPKRKVMRAVRRAPRQKDGWIKYSDLFAVFGYDHLGSIHLTRPLNRLVDEGQLLFRNGFEAGYSGQVKIP